jgi:uroporphyrinogen decarboxylase
MNSSNFLKALNLQKLETPPIWLMRQAGRYLSEYQKIRRDYKNFLDMCIKPEICARLALQPIERYDLDASILFSDILTIPDAFDLRLHKMQDQGQMHLEW